MNKLVALLDRARDTLRGEPARVIGYGAAAIIYLAAAALGRIPDVSPEEAFVAATGAITVLVAVIERIRALVVPVASLTTPRVR